MSPSCDRPLFHLFLHIGRLLEAQLRAHLDPLSLHKGRARLLMALASARSPQCINDLSAQLHVSQPTTTDLVKGLELQSLLQRIPSGHERRQTLVRLTAAGEVAAQQVAAVWDHVEINLQQAIPACPLASPRSLLESTRDHLLYTAAVSSLCCAPYPASRNP
ncbi:MAG: MarR family winged helix-turn-helix transcriptional regulator [Acidobacteriota bacterium]